MKKLKLFLLLTCLICGIAAQAAVVTSTPAVLQQNSTGIVIYFYAKEGSGGLSSSTTIYAHTGVITSESENDSDWKHAPEWLDNDSKYKLERENLSQRIWKLTIGDLQSYYNLDPGETVKRLAFVFRNADGSKEGKTADGGDIFIDVHPDGLAVNILSNPSSNILTDGKSNVELTANSSMSANIKMYLNTVDSNPIASINDATSLTYSYDFPKGNFDVIAEATSGGDVKRDTIYFCHRGESRQLNYSGTLKQGATVNPDGSVTFCLLAPNKSNVFLVGEWDDYKPKDSNLMNYQGNRFFWITVPAGLDMNKEYGYYFLVDDNINVGDPCCNKILDPWNDKYINEKQDIYPGLKPYPTKIGSFIISVFKGNPDKYDWNITNFTPPAQDQLMIYELLFRDFTDERSVKAAIEKLDYLKKLGINAIELMPIMEFDGNQSWGYNPNFYFAPDKAYGTPEDYKRFIDECHSRGIAVIMDVVFNHSFGQHPWCKMYWDAASNNVSLDSPFQNANAPHGFSVGSDWKQENTYVREHLCNALKYWTKEYKIDGYRFDLGKGLGDSDSYAEGDTKKNNSRINNLKRFDAAIKEVNPKAYTIIEHFVDKSEENELGYNGIAVWHNMCYNYSQAAQGKSANSAFGGSAWSMLASDEGRPFGYTVGYMESHDEERAAFEQLDSGVAGVKGNTEISMRRLGANAAFAFLVPGPKMIWQFGEMGYDESIFSYGDRVNPKPTHWEYLENPYRKGLYDSYSEILHIRTNNPDLFSSQAEFYWNATAANWDNGRFITARNTSTNKQLVAAYNPTFTDKTFNYTFDNVGGKYYINSKSYNTNPSFDSSAGKITVPAHSYVVITNMDPAGVEDVWGDSDEDAISIYPNPATSTISVNTGMVKDIEIYSVTGAMVKKVEGNNSVDVSGLASGNYFVKILTETNSVTRRLIKR